MVYFKHYSFDLWLTLIRSNPLFKEERAKYFVKNYNPKRLTLSQVLDIFRKVDIMCNAINEKTGGNIDSTEMYLMVIGMMNDSEMAFNDIDLEKMHGDIDALFFQYMPVVYSEDTKKALDKLKNRNSVSLNISSNTAFISGKKLRAVLSELDLSQYFDFQLYSDEINCSKPSKFFFDILLNKIKENAKNPSLPLTEILHVGDNYNADILGAKNAGIPGFLINHGNINIQSIFN